MKTKKLLLMIWAILAVSVFCHSAWAVQIWYEDNNLGKAGELPEDFVEKFNHPESFFQATRFINVYEIRVNVLHKLDDGFLVNRFYPYLKNNNIKLALDAGGATFAQLDNRGKVYDEELFQLQRLKKLGLTVDYIGLQSVLSKKPQRGGLDEECAPDCYPLERRMEDIVRYAKSARAIFNNVSVGIIDSLPSNALDYTVPYRAVKMAMDQAAIPLAFIHLDLPFDIPRENFRGVTWGKVKEVEDFVENNLGTKFGLVTTTNKGGHISSKAFHDRIIASMQCFLGSGGTPDAFVVMSWFPFPDTTVPENAVGDDYPAMRTVLDLGRQLKDIESLHQNLSPSEWRSECTLY